LCTQRKSWLRLLNSNLRFELAERTKDCGAREIKLDKLSRIA
jgi:hypothetical protein